VSRVLLIGCGKSKADRGCAARDLYTGSLFSARARHADASGLPWFIISAGHGLVLPEQKLEPYDATLAGRSAIDRAGWALDVALALLSEMPDETVLREVVVEIHAGADYVDPLRSILRSLGVSVETPVEGLGIGEQLAHYGRALRGAVRSA
jgi:hypothetical protein